jgi:hypothetical protein
VLNFQEAWLLYNSSRSRYDLGLQDFSSSFDSI